MDRQKTALLFCAAASTGVRSSPKPHQVPGVKRLQDQLEVIGD
jgi:hypothetical protein